MSNPTAAAIRAARTKAWRAARKACGLPGFERDCRCINEGRQGRRTKAYKVPGTRERGTYESHMRRVNEAADAAEAALARIEADHE
jgi:hypothetical protein